MATSIYYSEQPITSPKDLIHLRDKFYYSLLGLEEVGGEWWDEHKDEVVGHRFVATAYTSYGGDEYSALLARKFREIAKAGGPAICEDTSYEGENAILFGEKADEMCEGKGDIYKEYAPLGDLDDDMTRFETELIDDAVEYIDDDSDIGSLTDDEREFMFDWLANHGRPTATEWDFSWSDMEKALKEFRGEDGEKVDTDAETAEEEVAKEVSEDATDGKFDPDDVFPDDFEPLTDGETTFVASKRQWKIIAKFQYAEDAKVFAANDPEDRIVI